MPQPFDRALTKVLILQCSLAFFKTFFDLFTIVENYAEKMFQFFFCFLDQANEWRPRCERICSNLSYIKTSPSSTHTGSFAILQRILQWKRRPFYERRNSCLNKEFFMIREKCNIAIILVHLNRAGEINSRLSNDVQEFKSAFKHCISQGLRCSAQVNIETPRRGLCVCFF